MSQRGFALMAVIVTALIASVAAFGILTLAMSGSRTTQLQTNRVRAQYAAEAGLVWAQQKLWNSPTWFSDPGVDLTEQAANFDMNGDGQLSATEGVDLIMAPCPQTPPCPGRVLQAKVLYQ